MKWIYETNDDNSARFALGQVNNPDGNTLFCLGINPSTACPSSLDNTIRKVINISKNNNYDNWIMINIYPQRATDPNNLHMQLNQSLFEQNIEQIERLLVSYPNSDIWVSYGNLISKRDYLQGCLDCIKSLLINKYHKQIKVIKITQKGNPVHPLYQSNNAKLLDYSL